MTTLPFTCRTCGDVIQLEAERHLQGLGAVVQPMQPATPQTVRCDTCGSYWYADRRGTDLVIGEDKPGDILGAESPNQEKADKIGETLVDAMRLQVLAMHKCAELYRRYRRDCVLNDLQPLDPPDGHAASRYAEEAARGPHRA